MKDAILIKNLQAFCRLGSYDIERVLGQCINIDLELEIDLSKAALSNDVTDSVMIRTLAQSREFFLIENLAHEICQNIFSNFALVDGIKIEITKTIVNAEQFTGTPAIRIYRTRK